MTTDTQSTPRPVELKQVQISGGFWAQRIEVNRAATLPIQYEQCRKTGRLGVWQMKWKPGDPGETPHKYWDSDIAKWIEAAAYSLTAHPDAGLQRRVDEVIDQMAAAQGRDGYLNTHFMLTRPRERWTNLRDHHELYCAGHLIEAAVAYYRTTGKRKMLAVLERYVDHIAKTFGRGKGQKRGYCGHEEIELALIKLYRVSGNRKHLNLASYFVNERGRRPHFYDAETRARGEDPARFAGKDYVFCQAHEPVRKQKHVVGHAVRAMYLYAAMADVALETGDASLAQACRRLWDDLSDHQLYITGGIGASKFNEGFTSDFDLPNESGYAETCAAIGLLFWAHRMFHLDADSRYTDLVERCLYNGTISGVSLDGKRFFYVNPLESRGTHHRQKWFGCACCPPNLARLLASLGSYIYSTSDDVLYVHLYTQSRADLTIGGHRVRLEQRTDYPWQGRVSLHVKVDKTAQFTLALRIPGWCRGATLSINGKAVRLDGVVHKGYARIDRAWRSGDRVKLNLPMPVERIEARPEVRMNCGRVALQRGPIIYCFEQADNGPQLNDLALPSAARLTARRELRLLGGVTTITGASLRRRSDDWKHGLYRRAVSTPRKTSIKAVPYFAWDNRAKGEMLVWIRSI